MTFSPSLNCCSCTTTLTMHCPSPSIMCGQQMKKEEINFDLVKEYILLPDKDGSTKESVDKVYIGTVYEPGKNSTKITEVIFVEGKCVIFGGYKSWIKIDKYKFLLREYNLKKLLNEKV